MKGVSWLLELLFPRKCVLCQRLLEKSETDLCRRCRMETPEAPLGGRKMPYLAERTALWYYEGTVRESILRYKFSGARVYAQTYGRLLAMKISREFPEGFDVLTWVPVSARRLRRRGYDQAELLARAVGRELEMAPVATLRKFRDNRPQSGITGDAARRANVLGAYQLVASGSVAGKRILLLDDVLTTGATAGECARVLLTAGAGEVTCATVACARSGGGKSGASAGH